MRECFQQLRAFFVKLFPASPLWVPEKLGGVKSPRPLDSRWVPSVKEVALLGTDQRAGHICREDDDDYWTLLPGRSSGMSGESKFECRECGQHMFRGGWGSSIWLERKH